MQKIRLFFITSLLLSFFTCCNVALADEVKGTYNVDITYVPVYRLDSNATFNNLATRYDMDIPYEESYNKAQTYTIEGSGSVNLYTLVDKYDSHKVSIQCRVDQDVDIYLFKIQTLYVMYEWIPEHVQPEIQFQGSVATFIDDSWTSKGYTEVSLQGKSRYDDKWYSINDFTVNKGEIKPFYYFNEQIGVNYSAYRIIFKYATLKNNGYTLATNGTGSTVPICSCDYTFTADDFEKKMAEDLAALKTLQENTLSEIRGLGDLIKALPKAILDGIYDLFVPSDLRNTFKGYIDELLDSMGILGFPFEFALYQLNAIADYNPNPKIPIPKVEIMGHSIMEKTTFDLSTVGNISIAGFNLKLIDIVRLLTSYLLVLSIIRMSKSLLYDVGILKNENDDLGGGV